MCTNTRREGVKKTEPGSLQWCPVTGSEAKLKHRSFSLNIRKDIFPVRVTNHWHRLPREFVGFPFLEIF